MARFLVALTLLALCSLAFAELRLSGFNKPLVSEKFSERADSTCFILKCVKTGAQCSPSLDDLTTFPVCIGNSTCDLAEDTPVCKADAKLGTLGATCVANDDCYSEHCVSGKCNQNFSPGTPCKGDNECWFIDANANNITSCANGKCVGLALGANCTNDRSCFPNACFNATCVVPQGVGATCVENEDCLQSLYCNSTKCSAFVPAGASCRPSDTCAGDNICVPTNADTTEFKCVQAFTQSAGSFCLTDMQCAEGLRCNDDDTPKCEAISGKSSFSSCDLTSTNTCPTGEECTCNFKDGKGVCIAEYQPNAGGLKSAYTALTTCIQQCARTDFPCLASKCRSQICKYDTTAAHVSLAREVFNKVSPSCVADSVDNVVSEYYGYFVCSGASFLQYSLVLAVASFFAMLL